MTATARPNRLLTPDEATDHIHGLASAQVTLIEYGDFECPACFQASTALKVMLPHFEDRLRLVFRHFPLREMHPHAELAAEAAEAAGFRNTGPPPKTRSLLRVEAESPM